MPDGNNMNAESEGILNKKSTRRQFGKLLLASLGVAAAYKPLEWLEKRDKQIQRKTEGIKITASTATPTPDSVIPNISTPEARASSLNLSVPEAFAFRQEALKKGEERIPLPFGFQITETKVSDGTSSISCIEENRIGWIKFPALADGEIVNLIPPEGIKNIKAVGIKTKDNIIYAFLVPSTTEVIKTGQISLGEHFLNVNHNPFSDFQQRYESEGIFQKDTVVNIRKLKLNGENATAESLTIKDHTLQENGKTITIAALPNIPMPRSQQA